MPTTSAIRHRLSLPAMLVSIVLTNATRLDAAPVINEFMASNGSTLLDEDGDFSDYGLFDTVALGTTASPTPLWSATAGGGSISFAAIPEPSSTGVIAAMIGVAGLLRHRRA